MVDPTTVGSKHLTFGMVVVEPGGTCEPGHSHEDQEEIFFCLTGNGVVIADEDHKEIPIGPKDAVFFPLGVYHSLKNPYNTPLEILWIISPKVFLNHGARNVIAKLGAQGCLVVKGEGSSQMQVVDGLRLNSVNGAGDVFAAVLIVRLLQGENIIPAVSFANVAAALACRGQARETFPNLKEVLGLLEAQKAWTNKSNI